jgi:hypothetical protein
MTKKHAPQYFICSPNFKFHTFQTESLFKHVTSTYRGSTTLHKLTFITLPILHRPNPLSYVIALSQINQIIDLIMLSCPRCGTGYFKEWQSLSMHLTQYCQGPSLLCHARTGIFPTKHHHDQMLSGSCPTTFQQKNKNFNLLKANVSIPMVNTLHGMPSLLHLSPPQSELENSNVHYSWVDIDQSTPASADDQSITNDDQITDPVI